MLHVKLSDKFPACHQQCVAGGVCDSIHHERLETNLHSVCKESYACFLCIEENYDLGSCYTKQLHILHVSNCSRSLHRSRSKRTEVCTRGCCKHSNPIIPRIADIHKARKRSAPSTQSVRLVQSRPVIGFITKAPKRNPISP